MKNNIISFLSFIGILSALMLSFISVYSSGFALIDPKFHRALWCGQALITEVLLPYRKLENISDFITSKIVLDFFIVVFGILTVFKFYTVQAILEIELYEVSYFDGLYSILGLIIFIEVCRRSWGYTLFFVGLFAIFYLYFGAEHMLTGYDHILFLIGVIFFLSSFFDILKFITAFTIAHCITLIFATSYSITAVSYTHLTLPTNREV